MRQQGIGTMLRRAALRHGDREALICGETNWSYRDLDAIADRLCNGLRDRGVAKGDRIAIMARNSHAFVALRFAIARSGAILVPINFMLCADNARYILEHAGARLLFVDATAAAIAREAGSGIVEAIYGLPGEHDAAPADLADWGEMMGAATSAEDRTDGEDILQIIYTSGTESRPKGAVLTHSAVLWQYQSCVIDCEWTADTVALHALPLYHCAQLDAMLGPALQVGARNIVTARPSPENLIPLIAGHRVTAFFAPPTVWISLLRSPLFDAYDLSCLAKGYFGASIMPEEVLREMMRRLPGLRLWNLYGQTEMAPVATVLFPHEQEARLSSCGRAALHVTTRVVDDDMRDVAPGEVGEIIHRSPHLMIGYWNDPERTQAAFEGGWLHSGDLATIDSEGYITIVDRKKDMIKSGGENVSSREVEEIIYAHNCVSEAAVVGIAHPRWIEAVTAFVVLRAGSNITGDELIAYCRTRLSAFKVPRTIHLVEDLPRNASGKILKRELRSRELNG
jgi:fatty-acyl-CoA synthase